MSDKTMTIGEYRVRVQFNPDNNGLVDQIKQKAAKLINDIVNHGISKGVRIDATALADFIYEIKSSDYKDPKECQRLKDIAQDYLRHEDMNDDAHAMQMVENAAMWGVKAATCEKKKLEEVPAQTTETPNYSASNSAWKP